MSDQPRTTTGSYGSYDNNPNMNSSNNNSTSRQTVKFLTAATIGVSLLLLSGLILTGTVIGLIIATPLLVLFSPILVPAAIVIALAAGGFLFSGGCGVAAIAALSWIYNYVSGNNPAGSDTLDYAKGVITGKARDAKERAKDYGSYAQGRAQEATQGSY
ncbi:oleosin Ara h 15.0101-like [Gastrolobium bilobum]|uniref:oleosin Ara h 15.0101-like n=1 Tax=Gastrolobium bilobum TaxID=150636 RepID=UPI002AAF25BF|nr:oleosin Ara h 15.0101-like [Gastrolobium bilobum]